MTKLLELRERLRGFYGEYEIYVKPAIRFVIAIVTFLMINRHLGYMAQLKNPVVAIVLALICTFLPMNATAIFGSLLLLVHLLALSPEACIVALLLLLVMFFMYFKFAPGNGYTAVLTPVLCQLRISEVVPTAMGLSRTPYSVLSMVCGLILFYFLQGVRANDALLGTVEEDADLSKFTVVLQQIVGNKELYLVVVAFVITAIVVYVIRRQAIKHAWSIAIGVGNAVNLLILVLGSFWTGSREGLLWRVLGTVVAVAVGLLMEFFMFHLDYTRTERVQFEDDEYYYYVKAVPKVYVSTKEKQVKQINSRKNDGISKKQLADEFDIDQKLLDD